MTVLNLNTLPSRTVAAPPLVWVKTRWADAWTYRPDLQPTQVAWNAFPDISTASLFYRYGQVILPGANRPTIYSRITARGYWVLIGVPGEGGWTPWLGYAETPVDETTIPARANYPATGEQSIPCFGLERLWDFCPMDSTVGIGADPADDWKRFGNTAMTFNDGRRGNRSANVKRLDATRTIQAYSFEPDSGEFWSSRDILEYSLAFFAPTPSRILPNPGSGAATEIPWLITGGSNVPTWDSPTLFVDGRTVGDTLRALVTPNRMLGLAIGPQVTFPATDAIGNPTALPNVTAVHIAFQTRLTDGIIIPSIGTLPFDPGGIEIYADTDPLTTVDHTIDGSDLVDQVIVQGPREISVCTLRYGEGQLENSWSDAEANEYDLGGSLGNAEFTDGTQSQRRVLNDKIRNAPELAHVFRDLELTEKFSGKLADDEAIFPDPTTGASPANVADIYVPFFGNVEILPDLPLYEDIDYDQPVPMIDEATGTIRRPIFVTLEYPSNNASGKRIATDEIGKPEEPLAKTSRAFEVTPTIDNRTRPTLRLNVAGAPRMVLIDGKTGNEGDGTGLDAYDHETIQATVAVRGDRRPRWAIPADSALVNLDFARRRVYTFEFPGLEFVYLPKDTVIGVDDTGDPIKSSGGILRNPLPKLQALAETIARNVHVPRHRLTLRTSRILTSLIPGAMIRYNDTAATDIKTPIVSNVIDYPISRNGEAIQPRQTILAASYRIDFLGMIQTNARRS